MLLGEVNLGLKDLAQLLRRQHGDELHMQFAFLINQHLWLALAREQAEPLETVIRELPRSRPTPRWAIFLRNHDELTLDKLTGPQRKRSSRRSARTRTCSSTATACAAAPAPMLGGDRDRLRLAWSLCSPCPGRP